MKSILFVDDDVDLLNGLRARLHRHRQEWNMSFVNSGEAAIERMAAEHIDMVVSDVRMPGMDGGQLLSTVKARWPHVIRMVMSGYSEQSQILKLVTLAHRYVSKPCDAQQLENIIERCLRLDDLLKDERLRAVIGRIGTLPAIPETYRKLQTLLANDNATTAQLVRIVESDPVVSAKVLQVVNSAFFRLAKPIYRIKDAIVYLGQGCIYSLVMSAEVFSQWNHADIIPGLEPELLQAHAQKAAAACRALARNTPLADDALMVGLLHDIGYWVLLQECPAELKQALALAQSQGISSSETERQIIGATHAEVGAYLLGLWGLPYPLIEAVAFHHVPQKIAQTELDLLGILATAHAILATLTEPTLSAIDENLPGVDSDYFTQLQPSFDWEEATSRVELSLKEVEQ